MLVHMMADTAAEKLIGDYPNGFTVDGEHCQIWSGGPEVLTWWVQGQETGTMWVVSCRPERRDREMEPRVIGYYCKVDRKRKVIEYTPNTKLRLNLVVLDQSNPQTQ
jgi:hypothetical protein